MYKYIKSSCLLSDQSYANFYKCSLNEKAIAPRAPTYK